MKRIQSRRAKPRPGRVRGQAMTALRDACYLRDKGLCRGCGRPVDPGAWDLAHVRGKRMWGDTLANVCVKHPHCHQTIEHHNGGMQKIVPAKPRPTPSNNMSHVCKNLS